MLNVGLKFLDILRSQTKKLFSDFFILVLFNQIANNYILSLTNT